MEEYFDGAPSVRYPQSYKAKWISIGRSLEYSTMGTSHVSQFVLDNRFLANTFLAFKYFKRDMAVKHLDFAEALAL